MQIVSLGDSFAWNIKAHFLEKKKNNNINLLPAEIITQHVKH